MTARRSEWDLVVEEWLEANPHPSWRQHSDDVNAALITRWLPPRRDGRLLKTDLFDEIASAGLYSVLALRAGQVCGMDVSAYTAAAASTKYPDIVASVADVRQLPFADSSFATVVSLSTIDHFKDPADIPRALRELWRVLDSDGTLVLTVDNLSNPFVALRNALPYSFLRQLGLVSYPVGRTLTFQQARASVSSAGFAIVDCIGIMLAPRVLAIPLLETLSRRAGRQTTASFRKALMWMEKFQGNPVASRLAHFVAIRAVKARDRAISR
ncbi:MAG TPA: class I SAM-dependent methyltransferase [Gemmatimonadaceae bacterium]|nr:class I SAM-dependent methyltransferase [Gemmatimonadaceae bacterium]